MSGIEKIQLNTQQIYTSGSDRISDAIIMQLKKFGINVSSVSSESNAKEIIEAKKNEKTKQVQNPNINSEKQLIQDIKMLATTLGVNVSESDSIKIVLENLASKIEAQHSLCEALQDTVGLSEIDGIKSRYSTINSRAKDILSNQSKLNSTINALATTNIVAQSLV